MRTKFLVILLPTLLFYACHSKSEDSADTFIHSFSEDSNTSFFKSVFSDIRIIPLDLGEHMLGESVMLLVEKAGDGYLITDRQRSAFYYVDQQGALISRVSKIGRGPGEYNQLESCKYFDHRLVVLDGDKHLIEYTKHGTFMKEHFLDEDIMDFIPLDGQGFAFFLSRYSGSADIEDRMVITDTAFVRKRSFLPLPVQFFNYGSHLSSVTGKNNEFLCVQQTSPQLYKCNKDSVITTYHLDLHGKEFPSVFWETDDYEILLEYLMKTPDIYGIAKAFENPAYLFLVVSHLVNGEEMRIGQWLIEKDNLSAKIEYWDIESPVFQFFGPPQMLTADNEVVFVCDLSNLDSAVEVFPSLKQFQNKNSGYALLFCKIGA